MGSWVHIVRFPADDLLSAGMRSFQGGTYGGNAVASAAAVATIDVIEKEGLLDNSHKRGVQLMRGGVIC